MTTTRTYAGTPSSMMAPHKGLRRARPERDAASSMMAPQR
jgi:hypothetical protein